MKALSSIPAPAGLTLLPGGRRDQLLPHRPLPDIDLAETDDARLLELLAYAGVSYAAPNSPAARVGLDIFNAARALILEGCYDAVTFDWDHTFSNYQVFEELPELVKARRLRTPPRAGKSPMVAMEVTRPFMTELAFGMMVGFARRQGLTRFSQWESYQPRVGVASLTWPDRLARLATHYMPVVALMEALVPGDPRAYEIFMSSSVRSVLHLHHFLGYCGDLLQRLVAGSDLTLVEGQEVIAYALDRKAHKRKPLGAWAARGWDVTRLLHIDDSTVIVGDLARQAILRGHVGARFLHAPHPHSKLFRNVREWHKVSLPAFWRSRAAAMTGVVTTLVRQEWTRSNLPALLKGLGVPHAAQHWPRTGLPHGTTLAIHETPTTVGAFWEYYVEPTYRMRTLIRDVTVDSGGLSRLRERFTHSRAA